MKALFAILALSLSLSACVNNPHVTITAPDGTKTELSTGTNLLAEVDEQVSEVEGHGYHLRHMVKRQDATKVAKSFIRTAGTALTSYFLYLDRAAQELTKQAESGQITIRQRDAGLAAIEGQRIAAQKGTVDTAAAHGAEFKPVQVNSP